MCDSYCYRDFTACREACDSSACEKSCLTAYTDCYRQCPCEDDCPHGCEGCGHSVCTCKNPKIDNEQHKQCFAEAIEKQNTCLEGCSIDRHCLDACYLDFVEDSDQCPCMSGCELGCPCKEYECQPYITAVCQYDDDFGFSYIISSSGHYKVINLNFS